MSERQQRIDLSDNTSHAVAERHRIEFRADEEGHEADGELRMRHVDSGPHLTFERGDLDVSHHADNLERNPPGPSDRDVEALANRVLARQMTPDQRLAHDRDWWSIDNVGWRKIATHEVRNPHCAEERGRDWPHLGRR